LTGRDDPLSRAPGGVAARGSRRRPATMCWLMAALCAIAASVGCGVPARHRAALEPAIADRLTQYGPAARARLAPYFAAAGIGYPPERFVLVGFKFERELDLLAYGPGRGLAVIRSYPILGASGTLGPKLRQGDRQVPEGVYGIAYLNPNSVAHLSLALSYPNDYDRARAAEDGRDGLGGDIMIHGGSTSVGCIAIGDEAAEELFVLAADAGFEDASVMVSPFDFRKRELLLDYGSQPAWIGDLYARLRADLDVIPIAPAPTPGGVIDAGRD